MDSEQQIRDDIAQHLSKGVPLDDILVNEDEKWGVSCACTRADAELQIKEWDGVGDINDLEQAEDWLADHEIEDAND